jgi:phage N-6-adenine-methyltransferase
MPAPATWEAAFSSERTDWETPAWLFRSLDAEFGFTLDVCATPANAKCARYFTPADDGLAQDWGDNVCWMNPPYSTKSTPPWMRKAWVASQAGATVVCLVFARTDTRWFHDYVVGKAAEVRYIKGRVKFVGAKSCAPAPSIIIVYRPGRGGDSDAARL